jgi:hypothetical protein
MHRGHVYLAELKATCTGTALELLGSWALRCLEIDENAEKTVEYACDECTYRVLSFGLGGRISPSLCFLRCFRGAFTSQCFGRLLLPSSLTDSAVRSIRLDDRATCARSHEEADCQHSEKHDALRALHWYSFQTALTADSAA